MRILPIAFIALFVSWIGAQVAPVSPSPNAPINVDSRASAPVLADIERRLLPLINDFGISNELPGTLATALGFSSDSATPWPYQQISFREVEPDVSTPLHVYAVDRGSDADVLFYVESTTAIKMVRARRSGLAETGFEIDKEENHTRRIDAAEADAFLTAERKLWIRKVDETANWWACMGELAGAHQVTPEKKTAACNWLIDSGKETPAGLALAYANRGLANRDNERTDLGELNMAVKVDPSCAYAWAALCTELTRFGHDLDGAFQSCSKAIDLKPEDADGWTHRGDVYLKRGEYRKAIADYDVSLRIVPDWMWTHDSRGNAYLHLGDLDSAIADFSEAIRLKPDFAVGHFARGIVRLRENDLDGAQADFQAGFEVDPKCGSCVVGTGLIEIRKGDKAAGNADIAKGTALDPKYAEDFERFGFPLPQP